MTTQTRPYRSGHCGRTNPAEIHRQCAGQYSGVTCACECHEQTEEPTVNEPAEPANPPAAVVTEPGVYELTDDDYHRDPVPGGSLSSSGARRLLPPSCPARFRYEQDHPPEATHAFDLGHAAHTLVLGTGPQFVVVDADDWRTKAAREARKEAHEAGLVPLLRAEHDQVQAMAAAIRQHPIASVLFDPDAGGDAELALFWRDDQTGIMRRAKLDYLPHRPHGRQLVVDYKTARSAALAHIQKALADYGYAQQAAWYLDGIRALGLQGEGDPAFLFVFQEKTPPYLVTVVEPDVTALRIGNALNRTAINTYAECAATGVWPGYSDEVELVALPRWLEYRYAEEYAL